MFGHKLTSIPNQNYRVDSHPTIEQLTEMIEKARGMSGIKHNYVWEIPKDFKKYTLSLHCKESSEGEEIDWWLHEENVVGTKMHWFHKTKDIAVIYPHLLSAIGAKHPLEETAEDRAKAEKEKEKPTSLGERFKRSTNSAELIQAPTFEEEQAAAAAAAAPVDPGQASALRLMSGSLKLRPISWLLQTAAQSELTGELRVDGDNGRAVIIQFGLGRPVHAIGVRKVGTEAVLELFTWTDGQSSFTEGKQPETASVQDSTEEILKQGTKMLENLGYLNRHNMNVDSVLSRPPIGLSEEQLEERLKDGVDYGFKIQRAFYTALDGQLSLRAVGEQISLDTSRLIGVAVNFLRLGLILTPDGRSLREVASTTEMNAFANAQTQGQSGAQQALKPPAGFFGGGGAPTPPPSTFGGAPNAVPASSNGSAPSAVPPFPGFGGAPAAFSETGSSTAHPTLQSGAFPNGGTPASSGEPSATPFPAPAQAPFPSGAPASFPNGGVAASSGEPAPTPFPAPAHAPFPAPAQNTPPSPTPAPANAMPPAAPPGERELFELGVPPEILAYDASAVEAVISALTDSQTGCLTYPAFQFMLEREFARAFRFSSEFSLLIFCVRLGGGDANTAQAATSLPMSSIGLATQAIAKIKRDVDIFGHVGDRSFGLILPGVGTNQSQALVDRIMTDLPKLAPKLGGYWPILHFGIAGVPHDARDLPSLMNAAQAAMIEAANKNYTRIRSADM